MTRPRKTALPGGQRVVYGKAARPSLVIMVARESVTTTVLVKTLAADGTWWVRVGYLHPNTYAYVEELLPLDVLGPAARPSPSRAQPSALS